MRKPRPFVRDFDDKLAVMVTAMPVRPVIGFGVRSLGLVMGQREIAIKIDEEHMPAVIQIAGGESRATFRPVEKDRA